MDLQKRRTSVDGGCLSAVQSGLDGTEKGYAGRLNESIVVGRDCRSSSSGQKEVSNSKVPLVGLACKGVAVDEGPDVICFELTSPVKEVGLLLNVR